MLEGYVNSPIYISVLHIFIAMFRDEEFGLGRFISRARVGFEVEGKKICVTG